MKNQLTILVLVCLLALIGLHSCATTGGGRIPTVEFTQYGLDPGPSQTQTKADIEISLEIIRPSDIYNYPDLFSFNQEELPGGLKDNYDLKRMYPKGPLGRQWENPFVGPEGKEQLLLFWAQVKNGTNHILRMGDARIYLIIEGQEPVAAYSTFQEIFQQAVYFEDVTNQYLSKQGGLIKQQLPGGFYPSLVLYHKDSFKLINDLSKEILPGFTYEGLLVFPRFSVSGPAKISFFDITTKTDAAGNPVEKTQFDFSVQPEKVQMWYDRSDNMWKSGVPPST